MNQSISWGKIVVLVVAIVGVGTVAFLWGKQSNLVTSSVSMKTPPPVTKPIIKEQLATIEDNSIPPSYTDPMVDWYSEPKKVENFRFFSGDSAPEMVTYELGVIKSGEEKGDLLYSVVIDTKTTFGGVIWYFLKQKEGTLLFVKHLCDHDFFETQFNKYQYLDEDLSEKYKINQKIFSKDRYSSIILKSMEYPRELIIDGKILINTTSVLYDHMFDISYLKPFLHDSYYGTVYTTDEKKASTIIYENVFTQHRFYLRAPDGTYQQYDVNYSGIQNDYAFGINDLSVTWNDGSKNTAVYGEGIWYADSIEDKSGFRVTGKTKVGDAVYEYTENNSELREAFDKSLKYAKENMKESVEYGSSYDANVTFEDFVTKHPVVFLKDPFGRWMRFENGHFRINGI